MPDAWKSDKLVSVTLPPQNWMVVMTIALVHMFAQKRCDADQVERSVLLTLASFLEAARAAPAGYDQVIEEASDLLTTFMQIDGQPPLSLAELAMVRHVVQVKS